MTFHEAYDFTDVIYSVRFEGDQTVYNYTAEQIGMINTTQIYVLLDPLTDEARRLMIAKLFFEPISNLVALNQSQDPTQVLKSMGKYRLYSAHDTQIANIIYELNPAFNFTYIKYAANFYIELYRDVDDGAFFVRTVYQGQPFPINGCEQARTTKMATSTIEASGTEVNTIDNLCPLANFLEGVSQIIIGEEELKTKCNQPFNSDV